MRMRASWDLARPICSKTLGPTNAMMPASRMKTMTIARMERTAWAELYRHLILPVRDLLPSQRGSLLTVIPHGPLFRLSFAGLLDEKDRYLVESYAIHSAPAVSVLRFIASRTDDRDADGYLLLSNPRFGAPPDTKALPALPGSEREVKSIARLLSNETRTILNGGNSGPYGNDKAPAADWLKLADEYWAASTAPLSGGEPVIPAVWATDAVHGHANVVGATVFPHNIALGATGDADLIRRIGAATAIEIEVTGIDWTFAPTIAVARDEAFCFLYPANLDCLQAMGARLAFFSPLHDTRVPDADAIWLPGGYPELHMPALSANHSMRSSLQQAYAAGTPILAECGGMMAISVSVNDLPAFGLLPGKSRVETTLQAIGTQQLEIDHHRISAHTFHHGIFDSNLPAWRTATSPYGSGEPVYRSGSLTASFLHFYFPSNPALTAGFFQ